MGQPLANVAHKLMKEHFSFPGQADNSEVDSSYVLIKFQGIKPQVLRIINSFIMQICIDFPLPLNSLTPVLWDIN